MIRITSDLSIDKKEISLEFVKSSGPGGQKVNKASSAVQLRFDVANSPSLPEAVRQRLTKLAGSRINESGVLIIDARRFRTQTQNRQDAIDRLVDLIREASKKPKSRKKTRPSKAAKERRLANKHRQSEKKRTRRQISRDAEDK
jgi:ribosome-associated protein